MPFLTGYNVSPGFACRRVRVPGDLFFLMAVTGALRELTFAYNWEQFGDVTPDEAAATALLMWEEFAESDCMIGAVFPYATMEPPQGCLTCDGSVYQRVDYPLLYERLDPVFIVNADYFAVPDLRNRTVVGEGNRDPGEIGGSEGVSLSVEEMPLHTHLADPHAHSDSGHAHTEVAASASIVNGGLEAPAPSATPIPATTGIGFANIQPATVTIQSAGEGIAHNNMPPFLVLSYAIVAL